jgi:hypothetical protein
MKVELMTPMGNSMSLKGKKKEVMLDVRMLCWKLGCRILDEKGDIVKVKEWLDLHGGC